jgi:NAD(P)-dependent dehydrogenase (short-subunit alcohol dehydrogenase family)
METHAATNASKIVASKELLRGKTTVVTGAGRGIGKAIATAFAQAGATSIFVVRERTIGEALTRELAEQGLKADLGVADVTDPAQISMLVIDLMQRYPTFDILVNNAGVLLDDDRKMRPSDFDTLVLEQTLNVNLYGPIRVCNAFVPHIAKGGRIINVSSTMGQFAGDSDGHSPAYAISKAALNMYTQNLAADLRDKGIMVDSFHPGWVKTDMGGSNAKVKPEDSARTALFLATRAPSDKTGLFWYDCEVIDW